MSTFPTSVDSFPTLTDGVDEFLAAHQNARAEAIVTTQTKVGVDSATRTAPSHEGRLKHLEARITIATTPPLSPAVEDLWLDTSLLPAAWQRWTGSAWELVGAAGLTNPMTTAADLIVGGAGGAPVRLGAGADGQVLTIDPVTHLIAWKASAAGFANPMVAPDDLIIGGTAGTGTRLAKGTDGQVLTVDPATHHLLWITPTALANPMTAPNDVIVGGALGAPTRLAAGGDGQVLTVDPTTHAVAWANSASGFANPMIAAADLIVGGTAGTGVRLAAGSDGQVLTVDPATHLLGWATPGTGGGSAGWDVGGVAVSPTRPTVNLIAGSGMTITAADNSGASRTDVTFTSTGGGGGGGANGFTFTTPVIAGTGGPGGAWSTFNPGSPACITIADTAPGILLGNDLNGTSDPAGTNWRGMSVPISWPPASGWEEHFGLRLPYQGSTPAPGPLYAVGFSDGTHVWATVMEWNSTGGGPCWDVNIRKISALDGTGETNVGASPFHLTAPQPTLFWRLRYDGTNGHAGFNAGEGEQYFCEDNFNTTTEGWTPNKLVVIMRAKNSSGPISTTLRHWDSAFPSWV